MEILIKLLPLLIVVLYLKFIPKSILIIIITYTIHINISIFSEFYIKNNLCIVFSIIYLLFFFNNIQLFKKSNILLIYISYFSTFFILSTLIIVSRNNLFSSIFTETLPFFLIIINYIDLTNSKFNKLTTTFKNLKPSFYLFILFTASLFGFKYYLLVNSIKQPSFWYLFLTIPISGLVIYFYVKDLKPIFDEFIKMESI